MYFPCMHQALCAACVATMRSSGVAALQLCPVCMGQVTSLYQELKL